MVRDEEIKRLTKYAEGMGLKVRIVTLKERCGDAASWTLDGTELSVYLRKGKAKTKIILDMIHEIAHHVWFIHAKNRQPDLKFEEAIDRQGLFHSKEEPTPPPKHLRKKIYDVEYASTAFWEAIYKETNIKIPKWKLYASMEYDVWVYEVYYETGRFPKWKDRKTKFNEITAKHRAKNYE